MDERGERRVWPSAVAGCLNIQLPVDMAMISTNGPSNAHCFSVLAINCLITPMSTQVALPLAPLLITTEMNQQAFVYGQMLFTMIFGAIISFATMPSLLKRMSVKTNLSACLVLRMFGGLLWLYGVLVSSKFSVAFLFASRFIHGLTLSTIAIPMVWVAVRTERSERPKQIARLIGLRLNGVILGPLVGSSFPLISPNAKWSYASVGVFAVVSSAILLILVLVYFDDEERVVSKNVVEETAQPAWLLHRSLRVAWVTVIAMFMLSCGYLGGFEATVSLQVLDAYEWKQSTSWQAWLPIAVSSLLFNSWLSPLMIEKLSKLNILRVSILLIMAGGAVGIQWRDLTQPVPPFAFLSATVLFNGFVLHNTLLQSTMVQQLPESQQATWQAKNALSGQLGRAIGPLLASKTWDVSVASITGPGVGMNSSIIYMFVVVVGGNLLLPTLAGQFRIFYGSASS